MFAEGQPLGAQGLDWLYVQLANVWGHGQDKLSYDGRRYGWFPLGFAMLLFEVLL